MANLNLSQFTEKTFVADADWVFVWDAAGLISKKVSRNSLLSGTTADFHLGLADAAAPVAQTLSVQSVVAGTTNTAGVNFTINGSQGTGTGAGGSLLFRTAPAGSSGTTQNALGTALAITAAGNVGIGTTAPSSNLTVAQGTAGVGTISVGAAGTTITGVGTQFLNTFAVGQTITSAGQTLTISAIASDTSMTISPAAGAAISGQAYTLVGGTRFTVAGNGKVGIGANVFLERDGDNFLALRNGAAAQTFNVYSSYTDANNYSRLAIGPLDGGGSYYFITQNAGTGTARGLNLRAATGQSIYLGVGTTDILRLNSTGLLFHGGDNTYDIGASGANRPRNVYAGSSIQCGTSSFLGWAGRAKIYSPSGSNNVIQLLNNAENDFNLLILGLATSAFPAIKRSSTYLQAVLANDSGFTNIQGKLTTDTDYTATVVTPTGFLTLYDAQGIAYRVPCVVAP